MCRTWIRALPRIQVFCWGFSSSQSRAPLWKLDLLFAHWVCRGLSPWQARESSTEQERALLWLRRPSGELRLLGMQRMLYPSTRTHPRPGAFLCKFALLEDFSTFLRGHQDTRSLPTPFVGTCSRTVAGARSQASCEHGNARRRSTNTNVEEEGLGEQKEKMREGCTTCMPQDAIGGPKYAPSSYWYAPSEKPPRERKPDGEPNSTSFQHHLPSTRVGDNV